MLERIRHHRVLAAAVAAGWATLVAVGAATANSQTAFYATFVLLLALAVTALDARAPFSSTVLRGLAVWAVLHMAGGLIPIHGDRVLYDLWLLPILRFDHLVHAIGFGFAGLAFREAVDDLVAPGRSAAVLVLAGGLATGALNEMVEFLISRLVADTNIGGFENTGWDLVANTVGASLAAVWWGRHRPDRTAATREAAS